jgi:ribosomal protein S6--L-glutamate ligase
MKAALISLGSESSKLTLAAMKKYFDTVHDINIKNIEINFSGEKSEVLCEGKPIEEYDCIYAKGSFRYAELLRSLTTLLGSKCYIPVSANAYTIGHDKLLTQLRLQQKNIPMPRTYVNATIIAAKQLLESINYPIMMKFPHGTQGKGVMFADSFATASSILDALSALKQPFIIQEFIETGNADVRLFVVGDRVVAAYKRKGKSDEKRANVHAGGVGEAFEPTSYMKKIAVDAAKAIGAEICGIDVIEGVKGPLVIEVNLSPGLQGIMKTTRVDVADHIAKYLFNQTKNKVNKKKAGESIKIMKEVNGNGNEEQKIISNLDIRGTRILLPETISKITGFDVDDDVEIVVSKKKLSMKKFDVK